MSRISAGVVVIALAAGISLFFLLRPERDAAPSRTTTQSAAEGIPAVAAGPSDGQPQPDVTLNPSAEGTALQDSAVPAPIRRDENPAPVPTSMPYTAEFERIFRNQRPGYRYDGAMNLHKRIEQEARDPEWAARMESMFSDHYLNSPQTAAYGVPTVECRSTMCEIRLLAHGAGSDVNWRQILAGPRPDPQSGIDMPDTFSMAWDEQDGSSAVVYHVVYSRTPPAGD